MNNQGMLFEGNTTSIFLSGVAEGNKQAWEMFVKLVKDSPGIICDECNKPLHRLCTNPKCDRSPYVSHAEVANMLQHVGPSLATENQAEKRQGVVKNTDS